jgi:hypothetical protein
VRLGQSRMAESSGDRASTALSETQEESNHEVETEATFDVTNVETGETDKSSDQNSSVTTSEDGLSDFGLEVILGDAQLRQHKLGLDINEPWGWDGSSYNDYE